MKFLMAILASFAIAGSAFSLQDMKSEIEIEGEIVEVSPESSTITIEEMADVPEQSGVVRVLQVDASTELTANGEAVELSQLTPGARVNVTYVMDFGQNVARSIVLTARATE